MMHTAAIVTGKMDRLSATGTHTAEVGGCILIAGLDTGHLHAVLKPLLPLS